MKIWSWLVYSSKSPEKIALTIKGLATFVPTFIVFSELAGFHFDPNTLIGFLNSMAVFITAILAAISAGVTVYGFGRKIYLTAR